jgi:hypothetical protein
VGSVFLDLAWAVIAAAILTVLGLVLKRPRATLAAWTRGLIRRVKLRLYLQYREDTQRAIERIEEDAQRAIERIAAELAERRCQQEGNPDDEYRSDWYRWFTGDPDANVDYRRKQQRDRERLERGDFRYKS